MRVHSPFLQGLKNTVANLWISMMEANTKNHLLMKIKKQVTLLELSRKHGEMVKRGARKEKPAGREIWRLAGKPFW